MKCLIQTNTPTYFTSSLVTKKFYNISGDQNNWIEGPVHLENDEPLIFAAAAGDYLVRPFQGDQIGRFFAHWVTFGSSKIL